MLRVCWGVQACCGLAKWTLVTALIALGGGCSVVSRVDHVPQRLDEKRHLIVFFDGTANDEGSHTNVAKLHNLVTLQGRSEISTTYIQGVGTGARVVGMAAGWGIGKDVREGYLYLLENYDPAYQDDISIFGFSRGAYASRILAALLFVAGIPDTEHLTVVQRKKLVGDIYDAYKSKETVEQRRKDVLEVLATQWKGRILPRVKPVNVQFLGLWDTVEALGIPDYEENIDEPNERYSDQLCNVENAAHALSLDDDRARIFTPLLLTRKHLFEECGGLKTPVNSKVQEVWFAGAHSDVGGGYKDTDIDGISLNWMMDKIEGAGLGWLPHNASVYGDYLGRTHDPEEGLFGLIYRKRNRNISCYAAKAEADGALCQKDEDDGSYIHGATSLSAPLKIHQSVLDRLCVKLPESYESWWFREERFNRCLTCNSAGEGAIRATERCREALSAVSSERYARTIPGPREKHCDDGACPVGLGRDYRRAQSCNVENSKTGLWASQRLADIPLDTSGASRSVTFFPDVKNDRTGIILRKNRQYRFRISDVEDWTDCHIPATPEAGRSTWKLGRGLASNALSFLAKPFTYSPFGAYMELLGEVNGQQFDLGRMAENETTFSPKRDGELVLRVNEPRLTESAYENNFGVLTLIVEVL